MRHHTSLLLLPLGAALALLWANTAPESYFTLSHALRFAVNDVAMALFFGLLAQQVFEEVMPGGALHTWRRWTTPIVAAIGGTVAASAVFLLYIGFKYESVLAPGPIVPFLPHEPRRIEDFDESPDNDPTHHVEHEWHEVVQVILFFFGLVNAGVMLRGYGTGTWALLAAALVGRPLGALVG